MRRREFLWTAAAGLYPRRAFAAFPAIGNLPIDIANQTNYLKVSDRGLSDSGSKAGFDLQTVVYWAV